MQLNEGTHKGQSDSEAPLGVRNGLMSLLEQLEDTRQVMRIDANPTVTH